MLPEPSDDDAAECQRSAAVARNPVRGANHGQYAVTYTRQSPLTRLGGSEERILTRFDAIDCVNQPTIRPRGKV